MRDVPAERVGEREGFGIAGGQVRRNESNWECPHFERSENRSPRDERGGARRDAGRAGSIMFTRLNMFSCELLFER